MAEFEKTPDQAKKVYSGFLGYTKWAILLIIVILVGLLMFAYSPPAPPPPAG